MSKEKENFLSYCHELKRTLEDTPALTAEKKAAVQPVVERIINLLQRREENMGQRFNYALADDMLYTIQQLIKNPDNAHEKNEFEQLKRKFRANEDCKWTGDIQSLLLTLGSLILVGATIACSKYASTSTVFDVCGFVTAGLGTSIGLFGMFSDGTALALDKFSRTIAPHNQGDVIIDIDDEKREDSNLSRPLLSNQY